MSQNLKFLHQPVLIFGGPYSNLQATLAIKTIAEDRNIAPENVICTGDIIAYCGSPEETVNLVRQWGCHLVMGNCEESVGFEKEDCGCGFEENSVCATLAIDWYSYTVNHVSQNNKIWMQSLPRHIEFCLGSLKFSVIHGGIEDISEFIFDSSAPERKSTILREMDSDCIIGGHSGIPFGQMLENGYWLNPGVIGLPANEGLPHSWYMILEIEDDQLIASWHKLEFDNKTAVDAMVKAGLAEEYQLTLINGLWPSMSILPQYERTHQGKPLKPDPLLLNRDFSLVG